MALVSCVNPLLHLLSIPSEAFSQAHDYVTICFLGIPFIIAYNVISAIFCGFGDSRHPMYFVALAGLLNVGLDLAFIGGAHMQAAGAALAGLPVIAVAAEPLPNIELLRALAFTS